MYIRIFLMNTKRKTDVWSSMLNSEPTNCWINKLKVSLLYTHTKKNCKINNICRLGIPYSLLQVVRERDRVTFFSDSNSEMRSTSMYVSIYLSILCVRVCLENVRIYACINTCIIVCYFFIKKIIVNSNPFKRGNAHCLMTNALDCLLNISKFEFKAHYCVYFRIKTLEKGMNSFILPAMG